MIKSENDNIELENNKKIISNKDNIEVKAIIEEANKLLLSYMKENTVKSLEEFYLSWATEYQICFINGLDVLNWLIKGFSIYFQPEFIGFLSFGAALMKKALWKLSHSVEQNIFCLESNTVMISFAFWHTKILLQ